MSVNVGAVRAFAGVEPDKAQSLKVLEEAAEVFGAWQAYDDAYEGAGSASDEWILHDLLDECADVIQATCNLVASLGVGDLAPYMRECERRNEARGRYGKEAD